jgi:hypothetical protein
MLTFLHLHAGGSLAFKFFDAPLALAETVLLSLLQTETSTPLSLAHGFLGVLRAQTLLLGLVVFLTHAGVEEEAGVFARLEGEVIEFGGEALVFACIETFHANGFLYAASLHAIIDLLADLLAIGLRKIELVRNDTLL